MKQFLLLAVDGAVKPIFPIRGKGRKVCCHERWHWHGAVSQPVLVQLHALLSSQDFLNSFVTNHCQER